MTTKKQRKKEKGADNFQSIKIHKDHYQMLVDNKAESGVPIAVFVGQLIMEKLQNTKTS